MQPEKVASLHGGMRLYMYIYFKVMHYKTGLIRLSKFNIHHLRSTVVVLDLHCPPFDIYSTACFKIHMLTELLTRQDMLVASWLVLLMYVPFVNGWTINKFKVHLLH